ncbi:MAG: hypothetical protein IJZ51_03510 [Ruminiclostridium sp.]|nr:hypothetical protein [Ruminiclostridium sp.]
MKKFFRTILSLMLTVAIAVSTSGCMVITAIKKEDHKNRILSMLKEKYGEEFEVLSIKRETSSGFSGGLIPGRPSYDAVCCPVADKEVIFNASTMENDTTMSDDYPQAVIEKKAKDIAEEIVSEYTDDFIVYTYVSAPSKTVSTDDSTWEKVKNATPYTSAEEITIENYVDKYFETSDLVLEIVICTEVSEKFAQHQKMLDELNLRLKKLKVLAQVYYCEEDTMKRCEKHIEENKHNPRIYIDDILSNNSLCYIYYRRQETDYKWVFNESSSVTSYE